MFHPNVLRNCHWKCNKNLKKSNIFLLVCFTQMFSEIATGNVTKIQENFKIFLLVCFTQIYSENASGNVTKIKKSRIFLLRISPKCFLKQTQIFNIYATGNVIEIQKNFCFVPFKILANGNVGKNYIFLRKPRVQDC